MSAKNGKNQLKCVMLGKHNVGKSCLVERFLHDRWTPTLDLTVGAAFVSKDVVVGKHTVTMGLWDTAGSERYQAMTRHYYQGAAAAIICYDLTDASTWEKVTYWVNEILAANEHCIISLVGNKVDLLDEGVSRAVEDSAVKAYADQLGASAWECSSKSGKNVQEPFQDVCQKFHQQNKGKAKDVSKYPGVVLGDPATKKAECCGK